jgi:hypothetical protein
MIPTHPRPPSPTIRHVRSFSLWSFSHSQELSVSGTDVRNFINANLFLKHLLYPEVLDFMLSLFGGIIPVVWSDSGRKLSMWQSLNTNHVWKYFWKNQLHVLGLNGRAITRLNLEPQRKFIHYNVRYTSPPPSGRAVSPPVWGTEFLWDSRFNLMVARPLRAETCSWFNNFCKYSCVKTAIYILNFLPELCYRRECNHVPNSLLTDLVL